MNQAAFSTLPRGGFLVETDRGYIQFGSPPETIKDTMLMPGGVPQIFGITAEMFNWIKGISVAEIEFPVYYNYFLKQRKTTVICREEQLPHLKKMLQEAVFGPEELDVSIDFDTATEGRVIPDLKREMAYFQGSNSFDKLIEFGIFFNGSYCIGDITIEIDENDNFSVIQRGEKLAGVPGRVEYKPTYQIGQRLKDPYKPPLFGVTCLGPSHGFDPGENTSGFIIWLNHQGIMVDPPVNSTEWLEDSNVSPKLIKSIILTHCHADHDAGTFQKILEEGKISIYTTETVMMSFLRKYSALSDVPISYLMKLFDFIPVRIGRPVFIHGAKFNMFYTLHSIPTMGFRMEFQDQSFVYSSDHNNDPGLHRKLLEDGIISRPRYEELSRFPWDSSVIYHEAGIPPLHTPVSYLNSLPKKIQKRTVVYHIARHDFPKKTALTLATFGIENTLYFDAKPPRFEKAYQILNVLRNLDFLREITVDRAMEFLDIVQEVRYEKGERIIEQGTSGDRFYIIQSGNVSVDSGQVEKKKVYGTYEYFGEIAVLTGQNRAADVYAETDVVLYTIGRDEFLNFISNTEFEKTLERLAKTRTSETWNLLSSSKFFQHCTASQKTWLESILTPEERAGTGVLIEEGRTAEAVYLLREGSVTVTRNGKEVARLAKGAAIGSMQKIHRDEPSDHTFTHTDSVSLFSIRKEEAIRFVENNPGLLMKLTSDY
jgi:CRP-like cAMP-binding protein/phosphoribosyl 1,2-cyclic phosphodiesterase